MRVFWMLLLPLVATNDLELQLKNGSLIRGSTSVEVLEVDTGYGTLRIPMDQVRRVEFGHHLSTETVSKIDRLVKTLGNAKSQNRQAAMDELLAMGEDSYHSLKLIKTKDPEVDIRVGIVLEKMSKRGYKFVEYDIVYTAKFTCVGKITNTTFKMTSKYLGEVDVHIEGLRVLGQSLKGDNTDVLVLVGNEWNDYGIDIEPLQKVSIIAEGGVELWPQTPGQYKCGPDGLHSIKGTTAYSPGALIGKVNGVEFLIGSNFNLPAKTSGRLFLKIVGNPWNVPSAGSYNVEIRRN